VFKVCKVRYCYFLRDIIINNNTTHPRLKYMVITYLTKQNKNVLDTHKYNLCSCLLKGMCIKYRIKTIRKKINTKPSVLVSQKYTRYIKIWGFKNSPVVASFRYILPFSTSLVWFWLGYHVNIWKTPLWVSVKKVRKKKRRGEIKIHPGQKTNYFLCY